MDKALVLALCSLLLTALNDFVFKLFAGKMRSRGGFIVVISVFYYLALCWMPTSWNNLGATLFWGILGGFLSIAANILLIEAMVRQSVGLCSTIYRLNMVFVIAGAFFLLGEKITPLQWLGIALALLAILAFMPFGGASLGFSKSGFYMAVLAAILRGAMGISYKYSFNHGVDSNAVVIMTCVMWFVGGLLYSGLKERQWNWLKDRSVLGFGAVSGILVGAIVFCMAGSLTLGNASRVLPIAQMSFLVTFLLGAFLLHEKIDWKKWLALALGVASVLLLAYGN